MENNKEESNKVESNETESNKIENNKIESNETESNKIKSSKTASNKAKKKKIIVSCIMLALIIAWSLVIFGFSSMNSEESDKVSSETVANAIEQALNITNKIGATKSVSSHEEIVNASKTINPLIRKFAHFSEYFILAVLIILFINYVIESKNKKYFFIFLISLIICMLYAMTDEFHQLFVSGRTGKAIDVCIDSFGALIGLIFYSTYYLVYKIGKKKCKYIGLQ